MAQTYRNGTPACEATQQLVSGVEQFIGEVNADAVDALKRAVALLNNGVQLLTDEVLDDVRLATGRHHQARDQQLFQLLLKQRTVNFTCTRRVTRSGLLFVKKGATCFTS